MDKESHKKCVVILGMHRSGTSAVSGLLANAGVFFGDNLLEAHPDNVKGFWENKSLLQINENILKVLGSAWDDTNELPSEWYKKPEIIPFKLNIKQILKDEFDVSVFGIKDPRIALLLPLYLEVFDELKIKPCFLVVRRKKIEIVKSLEKRNGFSYEKTLMLIKKYLNSIEKYTKNYDSKFDIFFDNLIKDTKLFLNNFQKIFSIDLKINNEIPQFIEKELKHNNISYNDLIKDLGKSLEESNKSLEESNKSLEESNKSLEESNKSLEESNKSLEELKENLSNLERIVQDKDFLLTINNDQIAKLNLEIEDFRNEIDHKDKEIFSIKNSLTWRFSQAVFRTFFIIFPDNYKTRKKVEDFIVFLHKVFKKKKIHNIVKKEESKNFKYNPIISIILPVYNGDIKFLELAIKSVNNQSYKNWELCIVDDGSTDLNTIKYLKSINNKNIKINYSEKNEGISSATNKAIESCTGEYVGFLDQDDELTTDALYEVVKSINDKNPSLIYSDEDTVDINGRFLFAHYKPSYSPDLLLSQNYICHFTVVKKEILNNAGKFKSEFDGAQDHDIFLRISEITDNIFHISKVLYHWRQVKGSASVSRDNKSYSILRGKRLIEESLERRNIEAEVFVDEQTNYYRVKRKIKSNPLVSIIIPFKNNLVITKKCVDSILSKTSYKNYEVILVDHSSDESGIENWKKEITSNFNNVRFLIFNGDFNYSKINNFAVEFSRGEHLLFLNNDMEIITEDWIESMLEHSQRPEVGVVGAKLYYPNNTIQHAGVIVGIGGVAGHAHRRLRRDNHGYFSRASIIQNISAVTGACMMMKKNVFITVEGFDEALEVAFNDTDICLRIRNNGYINVYTPYSQLYHYESYSRGSDHDPKKQERFQKEVYLFRKKHGKILKEGDPYYNINLSQTKETFNYSEEIVANIRSNINKSLLDNNKMADFDWRTYVSNYEDLQKAGINTFEKAYKHWLEFGINEGRMYIDRFHVDKTVS